MTANTVDQTSPQVVTGGERSQGSKDVALCLANIRQIFSEKPPTLAEIYDFGEQLAELPPPEGVQKQRIAVAGSLTTEFVVKAIALGVALEGVFPIIYQAPYGSYVQEILDPSSGLNRFKPELVVLAPDWRDVVDELPVTAEAGEAAEAADNKVALFAHLWEQLAATHGCKVIQQTLSPPPRRWGGVADRLAPASAVSQVRRINEGLLAAGRGQIAFVDVESLAHEIGLRKFAPNKFYHLAKLGFESRWLPQYLPAFRGAWRLACGRAKKVLALDLDNTLWGGVIGDDGVEGIKLGAGSAAGEAFHEWQSYVRDLRGRGVILAACSKNDPAIAATGFDHAQSVLKRDDFSAFECSWNDKATALRKIAEELNVGIDSIVFVDDNPAECALVRQELPEVAVVHAGADPTAFIDLLEAGHWFDLAQYTAEDAQRTEMYAARAMARAETASATDVGAYLRGLKMVGRVYRPAESDMARVAQLEMKTNQFNVTTRRYSEADLRRFMDQDEAVVIAFRLADRFGDHGLVSTLIALREGDTLRIDSWLMSCRVFSRSAEHFIVNAVVEIARSAGAKRVVGEYRPTAKNGVVADLWERLKFIELGDGFWERALDDGPPADLETAIVSAA